MADDTLNTLGDQAQDKLEDLQANAQEKFDQAQAKAQAYLDSLPTPKELLDSIEFPELPSSDEVVKAIIPGSMTNVELIKFLSPALISLPGLNVNTLLQLGFAAQFREELAKYDTPKERQEFFNKYYDEYVTKNKDRIEKGVASINSKYSAGKDRLAGLLKRVQNGLARIANPPVVGTVSPNPTRTIQDYIDLKDQAESELKQISQDLIELILAAEVIGWDLPIAIDILVQSVGSVKKGIELIPV